MEWQKRSQQASRIQSSPFLHARFPAKSRPEAPRRRLENSHGRCWPGFGGEHEPVLNPQLSNARPPKQHNNTKMVTWQLWIHKQPFRGACRGLARCRVVLSWTLLRKSFRQRASQFFGRCSFEVKTICDRVVTMILLQEKAPIHSCPELLPLTNGPP